eukprot:2076657-Pleurochrysis_carterae.AAC.1
MAKSLHLRTAQLQSIPNVDCESSCPVLLHLLHRRSHHMLVVGDELRRRPQAFDAFRPHRGVDGLRDEPRVVHGVAPAAQN